MPLDEAAALAAVNAGIAEAAGPAPAPVTTAPEDTSDAPDDTSDGAAEGTADVVAGSPAGDEGGAPADEGTPAVEGADPAAPADGAAADPAQTDEQKAESAAAAAAVAAEAAKEKDPVNDPLPNALKKETKERMQSLITLVKEKDTTLQTVTRDRDELVGMITETKATPEQYGQTLGYLKLVNSPNRADREQALAIMQGEVAALARMLGKAVPGVNMLEGHQDLIDEVATGRISPERAQEIAAARARAQFEVRTGEAHQQHQQQNEQSRQATMQGVQALNSLEAQLKRDEPAVYAAKRKVLIESLRPVFKQIHPSQWAATFKRAYDALPAPAAPRVVPPNPTLRPGTPASGGGNTPLRASNPAGAARPAPASALDALNQGLAEAR